MKVILSSEHVEDNDAVVINDINNINYFVDDGESTELLVGDNFLSQFTYQQVGEVLKIISNKVAIGGTITIQNSEIEILASNLARGLIDVSQFNQSIFTNSQPIRSFFSIEIVIDLLKSFGFTITRKDLLNQGTMIVSGRRDV